MKITVHDSGSLFKANEIKRAVQGGQAQIGEIIISGYSNEDALYGVDSIPFLATSYGDSQKLWQASRQATEARLAKQGMKVLYAVAWPPQGIFSAKPISSAADLKGAKWRAYNPNTSRIAQLVGAQPVTVQAAELTQALATGAVAHLHDLGRHRLRRQGLGAGQVLLRRQRLAAEEPGDRFAESLRQPRQEQPGSPAEGRRYC